MTPVAVLLAIQAGIALATSLGDDGIDVLALGHVALGADLASAVTVSLLLRDGADDDDADAAVARTLHETAREPLEILAAAGGPDLAFLTGVILAAASMDVPVVLEDHGTSAAALVAARLAPAVTGYLIAAHGGTRPSHRRALAALGLTPLFQLGLGSGEGTGAALALGLIDGAARLLAP